MRAADKLDPAHRRIAFLGFDEKTTLEDRIKEIDAFLKKNWPSKKCIDHFYKGPYNDRKISKNSFVEFSNSEDAKQILKSIKDQELELKIESKAVMIKQARTQLNTTRNTSLRTAEQKIKEDAKAQNKEVKIEWKDRTVLCDKYEVFRQQKNELTGTFKGAFSSMSLT